MVRSPLRFVLTLIAVVVVLGAAACGDDEDSNGNGGGSGGDGAAQTDGAPTETTPAPDLTDTSTKPVIERPTGEPPRRLVKEDIVKGKGAGAKAGDTVVVHYVGLNFSNGQEFDASWDTGQPFPVQLGAGTVIEGWERGLVGIKQGGRRKLTIPPELGYGAQGYPPDIPPNETLVFVIDAVALN